GLRALSDRLRSDSADGVLAIRPEELAAPLPRGFVFYDGGCYPEHMEVIRQARGATMPPGFYDRPVMYQGFANPMLASTGHIRLLGLLNDVSLRTLVPQDLGRGFGFLHAKPESAMAPFVVTPDELGELWSGRSFNGGLSRYEVHVRGERLGSLDPGKDAIFD